MKKVITVAVHIQVDVDTRLDIVSQVVGTLSTMNNIVSMSELESRPHIFTEGINDSDILETDEEE